MNGKTYIVRNGEIEHVWVYKIQAHRFETYLYCEGTETEVREYIESEYPHDEAWYHALTDSEVEMIRKFGCKIYCAPKIE